MLEKLTAAGVSESFCELTFTSCTLSVKKTVWFKHSLFIKRKDWEWLNTRQEPSPGKDCMIIKPGEMSLNSEIWFTEHEL